jgi:hypothetical protein
MHFQQSSGPSPIHGFGVRWAIVWRDPEASSPLNLAGATILGASQCASRRLPCGLSLRGLYPRWLSKLGCPVVGCPLAGCPPSGPRQKLRAGEFKAARPTCCGCGGKDAENSLQNGRFLPPFQHVPQLYLYTYSTHVHWQLSWIAQHKCN